MDILTQLGIQAMNAGVYSGSQPKSSTQGKRIDSINPANQQIIAQVMLGNAQDYAWLIGQAEQAFDAWRLTPAPKRGDVIRQLGQALRQAKPTLGHLVALEMGKSLAEGLGEVQEMIDIADFAVGQSRMLYGKTMHSERPAHRMYEQWHPYGIVGVISAFNFPVAVWAWNAFIAAICGNVVVWKPSSKVPLCAIAVQHICNQVMQANDCPSIFNLFIAEDRACAQLLVEDHKVPLISFTGSTQTGRQIAQTVAQRLGRTILELGGNNAMLVDETADLALAIPAIVFGAVGTAGQRCTTTRRLLVHESIAATVLDRLKDAYQQLRIGDPLDPTQHVGPLIDATAVQTYQTTLQQIQTLGGRIVVGGDRLDRPGYYVTPTVVTDIDPAWEIVQQETFAPILYVLAYQQFETAIDMHNQVSQGLSSALFTRQLGHAEYFLSATGSDCGIANINVGTSGAEIGGAFGGEKDTGGGREAGSDAWRGYMRRQTVTINWGEQLPLAQGIKW
ncbi:MAG: aldehyde dehydrogenase family protein [Legionellales bacterium]|nr:aldehyde dehydrogenase family protein [Legionellales bacterium]